MQYVSQKRITFEKRTLFAAISAKVHVSAGKKEGLPALHFAEMKNSYESQEVHHDEFVILVGVVVWRSVIDTRTHFDRTMYKLVVSYHCHTKSSDCLLQDVCIACES